MDRAVVGWVVLSATLLAACGVSTDADDTIATSVRGTATSTTARTTSLSTTTSTLGGEISETRTALPVPTSLGPLQFDLPADAVVDPRPRSAPPAFVAATERWLIPGMVHLGVTIETIVPPMPAEELVAQFEANGLTWQLFDSGPRNGTLVVAFTTIGTTSVLVSVQSWSWDPTDVPRRYVEAIARTVQHGP